MKREWLGGVLRCGCGRPAVERLVVRGPDGALYADLVCGYCISPFTRGVVQLGGYVLGLTDPDDGPIGAL